MGLVFGAGIWSNDGWDRTIPEDQTLSQFENIEIAPKPLILFPPLLVHQRKKRKTKTKKYKQKQETKPKTKPKTKAFKPRLQNVHYIARCHVARFYH